MKIREINHGISHVLVDSKGKRELCINKDLKKYPKLYNHILEHELKHMKSKKKMDFKEDLKNSFDTGTNTLEMANFMIQHPKSFSELSPVWRDRKSFTINWFLVILYLFIILVVLSLVFILK
jgi:hypothetical protein